MFTVQWLAGNGTVVASDISVADDVAIAHGKALGRAIYLKRKQAEAPSAYRILNADGQQVATGNFPADLLTGKWAGDP
jgi:hypothetical protein